MGNKTPLLYHYGYITSVTDEKYIIWQVDDSDDYFSLTRQDSNILGFRIDMPVLINDDVTITTTTGALTVPRMTTAQMNALTAVNGMIIYDTTLNKFMFYENGAWVSGSGLA